MLEERQRDIFTHGEGPDKSAALKRKAHLFAQLRDLARRGFPHVGAFDEDFSGVRFLKAHDGPEQSAFAGSGSAQYDHGLAVIDIEIETVQDFTLAVAHAQLAGGDDRFSRHCFLHIR